MNNSIKSPAGDFSYLDDSEILRRYADGNRIRFYVGGVSCGKCVRKLEDLTKTLPGLQSLRVELGRHLAEAETDPKQLSFARLAEAMTALGYKPIPLEREQSSEQARRAEDRAEVVRLAVAFACAGNIMTFAFANYFGSGTLAPVFSWLSFLLYLPVVTYVAQPFYRGAWRSLKMRQISIDLPMAVASLAGFIFSSVELIRGRTDIYFDSLSGFLFLILLSRWAQKRMQRGFLQPQKLAEMLQLKLARKVANGEWIWRPVESLQPGDRLRLKTQELLPADAELISEKSAFSLAWLTGESKAKIFLAGAVVPAGSRLLSGETDLLIRATLEKTGFGKLLADIQKFSLSRNRLVSVSDRWAQWLLGAVFGLALVFLAAYWPVSPEQAIERSLALIILACPCALAFGTPLALAMALQLAQKSGLVVRDANVFERLRRVRTIFFDKTGTLTETDLTLKTNAHEIPEIFRRIVLSLENDSLHPIAFAFRKAFTSSARLLPVGSKRETPGFGVSGYIFGKYFELTRASRMGGNLGCTLYDDGQPVAGFEFEAALKPGAAETLRSLREKGYQVALVSGDRKEVVAALGQRLGFQESELFAEMTPEQKAQLVASRNPAMMIGDGINDSLALLRAEVGVAASGGMEAAFRSSQVYLASDGLSAISDLLEISRQARALMRQNLILSAIYNLFGATLALLGYVNPLVAAVLMPLSSGVILLTTWLRGRP